MPGIGGGANWAGAAFDSETGALFVPTVTLPFAASIIKSPLPHTKYFGIAAPVDMYFGIPICKPPYGRVTAVDLNSGDHSWMTPMGDLSQTNPALKSFKLPPTGRPARSHVLLTKTLLIVGQEGVTQRALNSPKGYAIIGDFASIEPKLSAYDKATGKLISEVKLPHNAAGGPMTYMVNGKQYIVVATGGANLPAELVAFRLP